MYKIKFIFSKICVANIRRINQTLEQKIKVHYKKQGKMQIKKKAIRSIKILNIHHEIAYILNILILFHFVIKHLTRQ